MTKAEEAELLRRIAEKYWTARERLNRRFGHVDVRVRGHAVHSLGDTFSNQIAGECP